MVHKNFLKILAFFMCMSFFYLGSGTALAANSWYVVSGDTGNQIKYYKDENATTYSNKWSQATTTASDLNTFLNTTLTSTNSGDTVYIKEGTYRLSGGINLYEVLHLYGGFTGNETTSSDRSSDIGTTLDAQKQSCSVLNIPTDSTIDSFTITGGNILNGGGIYIDSSNPTITNCTITGNNTDTNGCGGGIYISSSNPIITNCTITGNNANGDGGGIYIAGSNSNMKITNCTIVNNTAGINQGNEIYFNKGATLRNTLIWNATNAIGVDASNNSSVTYDHCAYPSATDSDDIALTSWDNP